MAVTNEKKLLDRMVNYDRFATYYDRMGADRHSVRMVEYCFKLFRKFRIKPSTGLDICCGTGTAISMFADRGMSMSGLDRSPQMLAVAAKKLKGKRVRLYQKELPRFRLLDPADSRKTVTFDIATCFYDSLNYLLTQKDLKAAFVSIKRHLNPGGWFIFDLNTEAALKIIWGGQVFAGLRDDFAWVWTNDYSTQKKRATCQTTFFVKKKSAWERFDEFHTEKAYSNAVIRKLLRESGFSVKGLYSCYSLEKPKPRTYRICVVARRK